MSARGPVNPRNLLTWLGLIAGAGGLILQFVISMQAYLAAGRDIPGALGTFFAYYTILTNCILVLVYLSEVTRFTWLDLFRTPVFRGMMAACIALVGIYVFLVLRHLSVLTGLFQVADTILHYLCPILYLLWWAAQPHGKLRWANLPVMLAPTLIYFVYAMVRGAWVQEYPYPFMNAIKLGYGAVLLGAVQMSIALAVLSATVIALDHVLSRNWNLIHD
ncbi:Pr6Pr family membrane protein [Devosia sp. SL43]|uniref:Pr6Pr family membrane protein n=1 Tax=Devosia sp. SL43 TaxID=2806348 RepID=UPI001F000173|nr:Pr6Pr family membrane protein [Devosia sp. SL43]UJW86569.1 Pr6Pr family membrane protein [Devosia sp. SL43]